MAVYNVDPTVALITLEEAKAYLKITDDESDQVLCMLINAASGLITNYIDRPVLRAQRTEYYNGNGEDRLMLRVTPIVSVDGVWDDWLRTWDDNYQINVAQNIIIDKITGVIRCWYWKLQWFHGHANVKVKYTAGWTVGESGTMPYDIRLAVCRLVDHQFRTGYVNRKLDVMTQTHNGTTTSYKLDAIPKDVIELIREYSTVFGASNFVYAD